jgi:glucan 1,3-beta-glucosidase
VNLGNWLVLEKWMHPALFDGSRAEDETQLCTDLAGVRIEERLKAHRDSYITERDFAYLANHGFNAVRIPVPYFLFGEQPPFVGCIEYVDRAFDWAEAYGVDVLIELHTVPDSQNGFDNGGMCGVCKWHKNPDHVEFALTVLDRLTARYAGRAAFWGIGVLNEPISPELWESFDIPSRYPPHDPDYARGSEGIPIEFLKRFYLEAYRRIRRHSNDVVVVFHDGFRLHEWGDYFTGSGFERFFVDTHLYLMMLTFTAGDQDLDKYLDHVRTQFQPIVREKGAELPLLVGEWCLNPMSTRIAGLSPAERHRYFRSIAMAQLEAWNGAAGWFFWSYKLLADGPAADGWDLGKAIELGYFPDDFSRVGKGLARARPPDCSADRPSAD